MAIPASALARKRQPGMSIQSPQPPLMAPDLSSERPTR